jgi:hypothetical protein
VPNGVERIIFAPVIALQNPIGVIVFAAEGRNADVKDDQLLTSIASRWVVARESAPEDELREGQARLEMVVTGRRWCCSHWTAMVRSLVEGRGLETRRQTGRVLRR